MDLCKRQDYLPDDLALSNRQLEKRLKNIPILAADAAVPASTAQAVYVVETKATQQVMNPNVQRKLKAATAWCQRLNDLPADWRGGLPWHDVLLAEASLQGQLL
ncbi:MAG: hypothetical protein M3R45_08330 [Pseudomonadota bacterium]|nr:hypothetical protein [Pseudomonadota bacterium]